ncbi:MAG: hypothetical protein HZC36_06745 [Armatimonadetes bacterium]|nr:hypothetical protein [Armatimonadota bacterium]
MDPRIIEGNWDDVSTKHAKELAGHRVEIRVLDEVKTGQKKRGTWDDFEAIAREITKGWRLPEGKIYRAEDFYESPE